MLASINLDNDLNILESLILGPFESGSWRDRLAGFCSNEDAWKGLEVCLREAYAVSSHSTEVKGHGIDVAA